MGFPAPSSVCCRVFGKRNWEVIEMVVVRVIVSVAASSARGEAVSVGGFDDDSGRDHGGEAFVEGGGTNAAGRAQLGEWARLAGVGENRGDALIDGVLLDGVIGLEVGLDGPQGEGVIALGEFERDAGDGRGGAMLDGERDAIVGVAAEVEVGITPGVEFGRSAQGLTGPDGSGALPGVMDDGDGDGAASLQSTEEGEQRGDLAADILIDAMQAHERIEDQEPRLEGGDGFLGRTRSGSASRSRRRLGAVITWTSSSARPVPAAAQPSRRRRTTCSASSAG